MGSVRWSAALAAGLLGLALASCSQNKTDAGTPSLFISASPRSIPNDGTTTTLTVLAQDAAGNAGTGMVALTVAAGQLGGAGATGSVTLNSTSGTGTITYACDVTLDTKCTAGQVTISGTWTTATGTGTVTVTKGNQVTDSGTPDSGMTDAGTDAGMGFGNGTVLKLSASKPEIILGIGDSATIDALLTYTDGGPIAGQTIDFSTDLGALTGLTGVAGPTASATTSATGQAQVTFTETGDAGVATIMASHTASSATATLLETIASVKSITWKSTTCSNHGNIVPCTFLGVKGTGFQEQAQVQFLVIDAAGNPVADATVTFSVSMPPQGLTWVGTGTTDANGLVSTTVSSGPGIGAFAVQAVVIPGVQTLSPTIGVVGVYPTNASMTFQCASVNVPAYVANVPPAPYSVTCTIALADRFNNPVGTGTPVFFKTESGTIPNSATTVAFDPNNPNNPTLGQATVTFQTTGGTWPPIDVAPFPALDAGQQPYPAPRDAEPNYTDPGNVTRNPRDGLITILAYVNGEKWYSDTNNNGQWDPGEPFVDQGDPFVDENDDNVHQASELCIGSGADGGCQGPSGVYESNINVWIDTRILMTSRPAAGFSVASGSVPYSGMVPNSFGPPNQPACSGGVGMQPGDQVALQVFAPDFQINRPYVGTTFAASPVGVGISLASTGQILDGYGFGIQRLLVDSSTQLECQLGTTPVCNWVVFFTTWGSGNLNSDIIVTDTNTMPGTCVVDHVDVTTTCLGQNLLLPADPGGVQ